MYKEEPQTEYWVRCFGHDDEGFFESVISDFELHRVCDEDFLKFSVGILYFEKGRRCFFNYGCILFPLYLSRVPFADDI